MLGPVGFAIHCLVASTNNAISLRRRSHPAHAIQASTQNRPANMSAAMAAPSIVSHTVQGLYSLAESMTGTLSFGLMIVTCVGGRPRPSHASSGSGYAGPCSSYPIDKAPISEGTDHMIVAVGLFVDRRDRRLTLFERASTSHIR